MTTQTYDDTKTIYPNLIQLLACPYIPECARAKGEVLEGICTKNPELCTNFLVGRPFRQIEFEEGDSQ